MSDELTPAGNDRNGQPHKGHRFQPGNTFGTGNPNNLKAQKLRNALLRAVTVKDLKVVIEALLAKAKSGDVLACRELLDRALGKPKQDIGLSGDLEVRGPQVTEVVEVVIHSRVEAAEYRSWLAQDDASGDIP